MNLRSECPVCCASTITPFVCRREVPVHQNLLMATQEIAKLIPRGDLNLYICEKCSFVFNSSFDDSRMNYSAQYNNTQTLSPYFKEYMNSLSEDILAQKKSFARNVIEVGCGKGDFLRLLTSLDDTIVGYGFDPSFEGAEDEHNQITFIKDFYGPKYTDIHADMVVCRHVIEHISDPVDILLSIKEALKESPNASVFFETPCVEWILKNQVIWDFFYEHCSYFTKSSLRTAFERAGFKVDRVRHVFGGQYLWLEASLGEEDIFDVSTSSSTCELIPDYIKTEEEILHRLQQEVREYAKTARIALWGAGAKGVTFANLIDPDGELIEAIVDINPHKQGKYLPGTGHPIIHYMDIASQDIGVVIVLNPNYMAEMKQLLGDNQIEVILKLLEMS